jgi:ABC-type Fe3+/spermidine/putrescine transport system ATPase subunit
MKGAAVALKAVTRRAGRRWMARSVTLEVASGGTLGLLGPSGCGKTTVLRLVQASRVPDEERYGSAAGSLLLLDVSI